MNANNIIRVFPSKTSMSPTDELCYFGEPPMPGFLPEHDAVHISTVFTWDKERALYLQKQWQMVTDKPVLAGGPAFDDPGGEFIPGMYVKPGVTITSRGCPNKCSFCFVPQRNGGVRELRIKPGNIIQDDNLLACSFNHLMAVFQMLTKQRNIKLLGLDVRYLKKWHVEMMTEVKIKELWIAYDMPKWKEYIDGAIGMLKPYFSIDKIRCYVLIGYGNDTIEKAEERLKWIYELGALPFAMLYHDENNTPHSRDWKDLQRYWCRPAIYRIAER